MSIGARIAMAGKAGSGKDFMLRILTQYRLGNERRPPDLIGFGELVRIHFQELYPNVSPTRAALQELGQVRREQEPDFWVARMIDWADDHDPYRVLGVSGVRYANEIGALQGIGFKVGLVVSSPEARRHRLFHRDGYWWPDTEMNHPTEAELDEIPLTIFDFVIQN